MRWAALAVVVAALGVGWWWSLRPSDPLDEIRALRKAGAHAEVVGRAEQLAGTEHEPAALRYAGRSQLALGLPKAAVASWERAFALAEAAGRPGQAARAAVLIAQRHWHDARHLEAREASDRALELGRADGDERSQVSGLLTRGEVLRSLGEMRLAEATLGEARGLLDALPEYAPYCTSGWV